MSPTDAPYGAVRDGLVAITGDRIVWAGPASSAPDVVDAPAKVLDARGGWITPGLIDSHTHLVFGGSRSAEFERRLGGATYEEIALEGGGILSTVEATRAATDEQLFESGSRRLAELGRQGVTSVEIKSGYGLDVETELRMLSVARRLADHHPVRVVTTLLSAHALPPEFSGDRDGYLDLVCEKLIPRAVAGGLADAIDAFCEGIAFTPDECRRVLDVGRTHGLAIRLHADQLSDLGGATLAASLGARSADHLEYTSAEGVRAMAEAGTTAVLLPGAYHFLGETQAPPVDLFRAHDVPMAVATDCNPGSSPVLSPLAALNLACVHFGLTPEEALAGMTRQAAPILALPGLTGILEEGALADLAVWSIDDPAELAYWLGGDPCSAVVQNGLVAHSRTHS